MTHIWLVALIGGPAAIQVQSDNREFHCKNIELPRIFKTMSEDKVLEVPCFGQPFQLGMLYDCRDHHLLPEPTLGECDIPKKMRASPQSSCEVFTGDSLEEKMAILGVDSSLKLSLMTGLVSPSGIANFIFDQKSSKNQVRVVLKYERTSKFERRILDEVTKELQSDISEEITATHFVSGIEYGKEAIFIFDRDIDEKEMYADVQKDLKSTIDSLARGSVDGSVSKCTQEMDAEEMRKVKCTFYENKTGFRSLMNYEDAVKACNELKKDEESCVGEVPKKVWLHPLSSLDPKLVRPVREVGDQVTNALQNIMANFHEFEMRLSDLLKNNVCSIFYGLKRQISRCGKAVSEYKKNLLETLSSLLPVVRRGDEEEKILTDVLDKVSLSPFHQVYLASWISRKEKEMKLLSTYLEYFKDIQPVLSLEDLNSVVESLDYDRVVCFTLKTANNEDDLLAEEMYTFLRTGSWTQEHLAAQPWFEDPELIKEIESKARNFSSFVKENEHNGRTKFIFTNVHRSTGENVVGVQLYEDGHPTDFEPPGKPEKPRVKTKSDSSVTIEWKESPHGLSSVQTYTIYFQPTVSDSSGDPSREWTPLQTKEPEALVTVYGLDATTAYLFKVQSHCKAGRSAISDTSDPITTEDSVTHGQGGKALSQSNQLHGRDDFSSDSQSSEAASSTGALTTTSTSPNNGNRPENAKLPDPEIHVHKPQEKGRDATSEVGKASCSKSKAPSVPYRLAETMLPKSKMITPGSPAVYKLSRNERMRQENSMIARQSIGRPPRRVRGGVAEKVLMVVGATGAGKTTLINGMVNYILGVDWKDDFRYKLVVEDKSVSQANSQTKDITAYTLYPLKGSSLPYTFTIVDTPGFGDTEGLKRDKFITNQIKEFFSISPPHGIDHLDGIGFVTQASLARLTPPQEYIFNSVLSIFGNDVSKNIFMMLTFADGQHPPVLEAIKKANIPCEKYFKFNNSALFAKNAETEESFDAMFWKMGFRSFQSFFAEFSKSESVSLRLTKEVLKEREQLQTLIEGLNPQITMGLSKIEEMRQEELILQHHEMEIETNKEFTYTVDITKPRQIDLKGTGRHTTTCLRCNYTCHKNCSIADDSQKRGCWAMNPDGNCRICTRNCIWSDHKNLPYLIEYETVTEIRTSDDLKKKYETAVSGKSKVEGMIVQLEEFLQNVHSRVMSMIYQAQQSLFRLDEIALKPNPLTQVQYLELLIESEKNEAKPGWRQRITYYEEAKRQAEILSKVKDVKAAQKEIQEKARKGDRWYHRFKFW
ncbi:hypothetical protein ACROYT_G043440 [Oculina patagonica]